MSNVEIFSNLFALNNKILNLLQNADKKSVKEFFSLQNKILFAIYANKSISPSSLVRELGIAKSNIAKFCKNLYDKSYIVDKVDKSDHRIIYYNLTPKGEKYIETLCEKLYKILSKNYEQGDLDKIQLNLETALKILLKDGD